MSFNLTPSPNVYKGLRADLTASSRNFKAYDILQLTDEPGQFFFGGQPTEVPADLLPFQTAIKYHTPVALNVTGTLTAKQVKAGVITSTSAAAVSATLPTATLLATELKAKRGTWFEFSVDNSSGASIVTVVVGAGITVAPAIITGAGTLAVAIGSVGLFKLYFISATAAFLYRIG